MTARGRTIPVPARDDGRHWSNCSRQAQVHVVATERRPKAVVEVRSVDEEERCRIGRAVFSTTSETGKQAQVVPRDGVRTQLRAVPGGSDGIFRDSVARCGPRCEDTSRVLASSDIGEKGPL